jgi:carboxyl-terminal processing protease
MQGAHMLTQAPLAILVNGGSASTAELLAGALHDGRSALLVGERTFGKGRTQRVIELTDGSTLLVSTMLYRTPTHKVVDKVGLAPDVVCRAQAVGSELWQAGSVSGGSLLDDPCVELAARKLSRQAS